MSIIFDTVQSISDTEKHYPNILIGVIIVYQDSIVLPEGRENVREQ